MTTYKEENTNKNEETMTAEDWATLGSDWTEIGIHIYNKAKKGLLRRGFMMGLLTALAVQSLATIIVMLIMMT